MSFKEEFLKSKPGAAREALIFNEVIKRGPPKELVPVTVTTPDGSKITYRVMPDYVMIEGIRVPMAGMTAQRVADYFGMKLPTPKMSKQIWDAADTKIMPTPLSAGGTIGGKYYSPQEVVERKISDSDSSVAYNQMIDKQLSKKTDTPTLVAGHMKDVVQPVDPNKLGLYGWYGKDGKPVQYSPNTPHDISIHTEYGAGTRLVADKVTITRPDGKIETRTMDEVQSDPNLFKAISNSPGNSRYNLGKKETKVLPSSSFKETATPKPQLVSKKPVLTQEKKFVPGKPQPGRLTFLQRIDNFLSQFIS